MLLEKTEFNQHAIELEKNNQIPYRPIYSLGPVKLEILKTYIKTYLKTRFIQLSKSHLNTPILFDKKLDGNLPLYVDYQSLNNLTIKNWYLLSLIGESLE